MTRISLVIPTHNRCSMLQITMPYYLKQKCVEEIIIVDDASNDLTESYISGLSKDDSRIKYIKNGKRQGPSHSRNIGIRAASCEYVLMGEDDVILQVDYALTLLDRMIKNSADIIGGRLLYLQDGESLEDCLIRYDKRVLQSNNVIIKEPFILGDFSSKKTEFVLFLHACSLFKRRVFNFVQYDEYYQYNYYREETDVYLNAAAKGFAILYAGDITAFHMSSNLGALSGVHHLKTNVVALRILGFPRQLSSRNLKSRITRVVFYHMNIDDDLMKFLNNSYFIDKYYSFLKRRLHLNKRKIYYKIAFAKFLVEEKTLFFQKLLKDSNN